MQISFIFNNFSKKKKTTKSQNISWIRGMFVGFFSIKLQRSHNSFPNCFVWLKQRWNISLMTNTSRFCRRRDAATVHCLIRPGIGFVPGELELYSLQKLLAPKTGTDVNEVTEVGIYISHAGKFPYIWDSATISCNLHEWKEHKDWADRRNMSLKWISIRLTEFFETRRWMSQMLWC